MADFAGAEWTERIIGAAIHVHRELGPGFGESIYENALRHELQKRGMHVQQQKVFPVLYDGIQVGKHRIDLIVDDLVLIELKAVEELIPLFTAQVISYLRVTRLEVGLLMNFNEKLLKNGLTRVVSSENKEYQVL